MDFSRLNRSKGVKVAAATVGGAAALGATVAAAAALTAAPDGVINACYDQKGNLRVINAATENCGKNEFPISWNQQGPQGPIGPIGPNGADGEDGAPGAPGAQGEQGPAGPAGAQGPAGATGANGQDGTPGGGGAAAPQGPDCSFMSSGSGGGSDIFLKLDGIVGDSLDAFHKGDIDLIGTGFSGKRGPFAAGQFGSGPATFGHLCFLKRVDRSSPDIIHSLAAGQHIKSAEITYRKAGKDQLEYYVIKLSDVLVSSYSTGSAGEVPVETIALNFNKFEIKYTPQKADGSSEAPINIGWDLTKDQKF